jgi:hypothetical protein
MPVVVVVMASFILTCRAVGLIPLYYLGPMQHNPLGLEVSRGAVLVPLNPKKLIC